MQSQKFDIIIIGGGSIGLSCALALSHRAGQKLNILILDRSPQDMKISHEFDGRNIALNGASKQFFKNLGIWDHLAENAQPINHIIVSDGTVRHGASDSFIHFNAQDISQDDFGAFVLNPNIHKALLNKIHQDTSITLCSETYITDIQEHTDHIQVTDQNQQTYSAKLLIAADGKNSFVRSHFGIDVALKDYKKTAIVLSVAHEKPHHGIAQEFFLPAGPFAILPLCGNQSSLVWVEDHKIAQALLDAPEDIFQYELERRFGDYLGKLKITSKKFSYSLIRQISKEITAQRTLFIGDSAHVIHPISGQGFNLGLRDIGFLSDIIYQHHYAGLDIGASLVMENYQKARQRDIQLFGLVTNSLNCLFSNDIFLLQTMRRFGLMGVNKLLVLRNFFSKAASEGTIGELPMLMKEG